MKKLLKKKNKGFSLVELIVVVLIMAIIAVALAPQVMKWVNNARKSSDATTYKSVYSAVQLAMADKEAYNEVTTAAAAITINLKTNGIDGFDITTYNQLHAALQEILGTDYRTTKTKLNTYTITVTTGGAVVGDPSVLGEVVLE